MTVTKKKHMTAFAAGALIAVAVSACGGDGPNNGPPPPMYVNVDLSGLMSGFSTPEGNFTIRAGQHVDRGDVRFQCAAGGEDCTVMVAAEDGATTAQARRSGGTVTAVDVPQPPGKEDVDLSDVTVGYLADQIMMLEIEAGESEDHGDITFSCASGGDDCVVMVMVADDGMITAMSSGGEVTASDAGDPNTLVDQRLDAGINRGSYFPWPSFDYSSGAPDANSDFTEMMDPDFADIDGWDHIAYERENSAMGMNPASTETYVIYSNNDFETDRSFFDVHSRDYDVDMNTENDSLQIAYGGTVLVDGSQIGGENIPSTVMAMDDFEGTFDGAEGTYTCVNMSNDCLLSFDSNGVSAIAGHLVFTPDDGETVVAPDPDYIFFGYWINESTDDDDNPVFDVAAFYGGAEQPYYSDVHMLAGGASYAGPATGLYVRRWTDSDSGDVLRRRTGQFTADASLEADFGGDSIAADAQFMIEGTISNFADAERGIDLGWQLTLESADFGPSLATPWFLGDTQGGGDDTGSWWGEFFGLVTPDDPSTTSDNESVYPSGVTGGFTGDFPNGEVVGAYGAELQE